MTDTQWQEYHRFQRFIQITLTISGCWYMPTKFGKSTYYWSVFTFLLTMLYAVIYFNMGYISRNNLRKILNHIGLIMSKFGVLLKMGTFIINRSSLINCHQMLKNLLEEELEQNEKIWTITFSSLRKMSTLVYTYATVTAALILVYYLPPSLLIIRDLCRLRSPPTSYVLPVTKGLGYLWTLPDNFLYHFHFLLELLNTIVTCVVAMGVEGAFGFYVYHFVSTMQAMTFRLTNPLPTENLSDILRKCVVKHRKLMQCRDTLEHIYGKIIFYYVVSNAVALCTLLYVMSLTGFHFKMLVQFLIYSIVKLFQTFVYAWFGTLLTNASENFRQGIYFGDWYKSSLNLHMRTSIILMMMQKPMTINAIFSSVGIVMFMNVVNTTMSYFFLLQSIDNDT